MREYEIQNELEALQCERRRAADAYSWGNGHRSQYYTDLDPIIDLLKAWLRAVEEGAPPAAFESLAEQVPNGENLLSLDSEEPLFEAAEERVEDLAQAARKRAQALAMDVAKAEYLTIPERLAEACYEQGEDDLGEQVENLTPAEAACAALRLGISVEDEEGSRGISTHGGQATGWAIVRSWRDDDCEIVEYDGQDAER